MSSGGLHNEGGLRTCATISVTPSTRNQHISGHHSDGLLLFDVRRRCFRPMRRLWNDVEMLLSIRAARARADCQVRSPNSFDPCLITIDFNAYLQSLPHLVQSRRLVATRRLLDSVSVRTRQGCWTPRPRSRNSNEAKMYKCRAVDKWSGVERISHFTASPSCQCTVSYYRRGLDFRAPSAGRRALYDPILLNAAL
ncbi:hypothetical protein DENSPDRAFT_224828 [Dentipellis sp. KUC8613]|nr:hypothetical protein DENSPDRAFT_224828 [Dentipellis sp. KUC8613]